MFSKKQLWDLLIPLMIEQLLNSLMGTADTMMVSNVGSAAISAVSLVDSINVLVINVFSALATGGCVVCAQYLGRRDKPGAIQAGKQLILAVAALSTAIMLICVLLRRPLLRLIFGQVEPAVMTNAETYLLITGLSYPFIALYNAGAAIFRAEGNSKLPMTISTISNGLNIVGNAVLIFVFHLDVAGAALSTLFSRMFCAVTVLFLLRAPQKPEQVVVIRNYLSIRPNFPMIGNILGIGIPTGVENGMFQFGKLAIQSTVSTMGTVAIAAQAMTAVLEQLTSMAPMGIGLGMVTVVGQCIGAGKKQEARTYLRLLTKYGTAAVAISCLVTAFLVKPITVLGGMEPAAAAMTVQLTWLICLYKPIAWPMSFIPAYGMRAAGDVRFSMLLSAITMWSCRVVITVLLARVWGLGPIAVWIGMFSDWTVRSLAFTWRLRSGKWLDKSVLHSGKT